MGMPAEVKTVAALSPSAADFATALGLEVVAGPPTRPQGRSRRRSRQLRAIPDFDAVAAADPDLVLADAAYQSGRTRDFDRSASRSTC